MNAEELKKIFISKANPLTERQIEEVAIRNGLTKAHIKAVLSVESGGSGFYKSKKPKILFEAHLFSRLTKNKFDKSHPHLSSPKWNKALYTKDEYKRLEEAMDLDLSAALQSTSWGLFQILGMNFTACNVKSVIGFVKLHCLDEYQHLCLFINFLKKKGLIEKLLKEDWAGFAKVYNGPSYASNKYDEKLKAAFEKAKKA